MIVILGELLKKYRKEKGLTQDDVAKHLGVSRPNITQYEKGLYEPSSEALSQLAKLFNVDVSAFFNSGIKPVKKIPIIGTSSCGMPTSNDYQVTNEFAYYNGTFYSPDLYCIIACGNSMSPEIEDGDEVICDPKSDVTDGDIVHYSIGSESAIKIYVRDEEAFIIQLIPYNQSETFKTRTIRLDDEEANNLKIAKVVSINKLKFNNRKARLKLIGRA